MVVELNSSSVQFISDKWSLSTTAAKWLRASYRVYDAWFAYRNDVYWPAKSNLVSGAD